MQFIQTIHNLLSPKQIPESIIIDPLLIGRILQLEELFHDRKYRLDHVNTMLQLYASLLERFDGGQQAMKKYFLEKMQFLLSRPETIKLMIGEQESELMRTTNMRLTQMRMTYGQLRNEEENRFHRPFLVGEKMRFSVDKSKEQRALQMKICIDIEESKQESKRDMKELIKDYEETSRDYDKAIKQQLSEQNDKLTRRLKSRKRSNSVEKSKQNTGREALIYQIEESVNFMRQSINKWK